MLQRIIRTLLKYIPRPVLIRLSLMVNRVVALFYWGNKVACPVCEHSFSKFLPYGYTKLGSRKNALCPRCLSLERHRLMYLYLKEKTDFFSRNLKVLHIAPEQCFYKRFRALDNLDYTTGDLESPIADVHFDVQAIPFPKDTYDVVICNHVLEHVADDKQAMAEIYRILKPGGFAVLQVPQDTHAEKTYEDPTITDPDDREKHFLQKDHVRLYGLDYAERLSSVGFRVTADTYSNNFPQETAKRFGLPLKEIFYFNQK